jgi:peptidoglycan/xylan/chitin deacetylase (PgdA/CDA1 family)
MTSGGVSNATELSPGADLVTALARGLRVARRLPARALMRRRRRHGLILLYHRIAAPAWDPWNVCVSPKHFEQQLAALRRVAEVVPLSALDSRLRAGRTERPVISLTLDDGYADNLYVALPLLEQYEIPATVFLATGWIGRPEPFWWDRLSEIVRSIRRAPSEVRLPIGDDELVWRRNPQGDNDRRERDDLHLAVWSRLVVTSDEERRVALGQLESYVDRETRVDPATRPMTTDEVRCLASSPLIEIGAHTMSHCSLPDLAPDEQFEEILGSRRQCHELTGKFPSSFAYPYGGFDAGTPELVRSAGFDRACSIENNIVWDGGNKMQLPRVWVKDYSVREFSARLRLAWLP